VADHDASTAVFEDVEEMMKRILPILLLLLTSPAHAGWWVNIGGLSIHTQPGFNSRNPALGGEYDYTSRDLVAAGVYLNSYSRTSHYLVYGRRAWVSGPMSAGVAVGVVDGYPNLHNGGVIPWAAPFVAVEGDTVGMNVLLIPAAEKGGAWALAAQIKLAP